jgi:dsRNA-specific ribonuclease
MAKKYLYLISFCCFLSFPLQAMESLIFEEPAFMSSPLRAEALQPRTIEFEQLEFLGDRVLGLIAAHMLYKGASSFDREVGGLARRYEILVSKPVLMRMYYDLPITSSELSSYAYCAPTDGRISEKTASDIVEALMGALYKEKGFECIQEPLEQFIKKYEERSEDDWLFDEDDFLKPQSLTSAPRRQPPPKSCPNDFKTLQKTIGYRFTDYGLLQEAFKHSSVEGALFKKLDFLGVRVLALDIADHVFSEYGGNGEGCLMACFETLINNDQLEEIFQKWQFKKYLKIQSGIGISTRVAASTVRTLIAAVYLDGGLGSASTVISTLFSSSPSSQAVTTGGSSSEEEWSLPETSLNFPEDQYSCDSDWDEWLGPLEKEPIHATKQKESWPSLTCSDPKIIPKNSIWNNGIASRVKAPTARSQNSQV